MDNIRKYETELCSLGYSKIGGLDEAGRGCWAGPLVVALCVLPNDFNNPIIKDSKKLSEKQRNEAYKLIVKNALYYDVLEISSKEVDCLNPKQASIFGMEYLIKKAKDKIDFALIDAEQIECNIPNMSIIKGDQKSINIAAASILAKVTRDRIMYKLEKKFSNFQFGKHKGYGTKLHLEELKLYGPINNIHRFSYKPIKKCLK